MFLATRPFKEEAVHRRSPLLRCFISGIESGSQLQRRWTPDLRKEALGKTEVQPSPWVLRELSSGSDQKDWSLHCPGRGDLDSRRQVEGGAGEMSNLNILGKELGSGRSVRVPAGVGTCGGIGGMRGVQNAGSRNESRIGLDSVLDPLGELTEVGVDAGSVGLGAGEVSPGHEALQGTIADHGAPGITLWRRQGGTERQRCGEMEGGGHTDEEDTRERDTGKKRHTGSILLFHPKSTL